MLPQSGFSSRIQDLHRPQDPPPRLRLPSSTLPQRLLRDSPPPQSLEFLSDRVLNASSASVPARSAGPGVGEDVTVENGGSSG